MHIYTWRTFSVIKKVDINKCTNVNVALSLICTAIKLDPNWSETALNHIMDSCETIWDHQRLMQLTFWDCSFLFVCLFWWFFNNSPPKLKIKKKKNPAQKKKKKNTLLYAFLSSYRLDVTVNQSDLWTPAQIITHASKDEHCAPSVCSQECGTVPVGNPVGGVLGAHSVFMTVLSNCKANGLQQHQWKRLWGLRTAITASEPTPPVHPLHTALYSQPACVLFVRPLVVGQQMTNNPVRQPHSSVMHSEHMK